MSKANKALEGVELPGIVFTGGNFEGKVTLDWEEGDVISCRLGSQSHGQYLLTADEAITLGKWLIDTFGD